MLVILFLLFVSTRIFVTFYISYICTIQNVGKTLVFLFKKVRNYVLHTSIVIVRGAEFELIFFVSFYVHLSLCISFEQELNGKFVLVISLEKIVAGLRVNKK